MLSFGINLRTLRVQKNLSQQDIADRLSINRTTYTKWELGVSEPSLTMMLTVIGFWKKQSANQALCK